MSMSVCTLNIHNSNYIENLYENIIDPNTAVLLAQLSMCNKKDDELICIFPGFNLSIDKNNPEAYKKALLLAEKYKVDNNKNCNNNRR